MGYYHTTFEGEIDWIGEDADDTGRLWVDADGTVHAEQRQGAYTDSEITALVRSAADVLALLHDDHEACPLCDEDDGHAVSASCALLAAALVPFANLVAAS